LRDAFWALLRGLHFARPACLHHCVPWDFWLIFFFLSVFLPWRGRERIRHLLGLAHVSTRDRIQLYIWTILFQWVLAIVVGWRAVARGLSNDELGLTGGWTPTILLLSIAGAGLIGVAHWMNLRRMARSNHPALERLRALGARLFPRSTSELVFYIVLALTAGICEEFIFRGFVIAALFRAGLSTWTVVLVSALMFGVAHLYQGKGGSAGTGILGIVFAMVRITYHSLLPVTAWHAALDIVAGIAGARFFTPNFADRGPVAEGDARNPMKTDHDS
jgi:membrane protease YdiL (CAAX protease family)